MRRCVTETLEVGPEVWTNCVQREKLVETDIGLGIYAEVCY